MYKHKSGALKRKEKLEKNAKEFNRIIFLLQIFLNQLQRLTCLLITIRLPHPDHVAILNTIKKCLQYIEIKLIVK